MIQLNERKFSLPLSMCETRLSKDDYEYLVMFNEPDTIVYFYYDLDKNLWYSLDEEEIEILRKVDGLTATKVFARSLREDEDRIKGNLYQIFEHLLKMYLTRQRTTFNDHWIKDITKHINEVMSKATKIPQKRFYKVVDEVINKFTLYKITNLSNSDKLSEVQSTVIRVTTDTEDYVHKLFNTFMEDIEPKLVEGNKVDFKEVKDLITRIDFQYQ